jgi:polynucleotide 5'-hydroxyl-kinase GRC3/NOL9
VAAVVPGPGWDETAARLARGTVMVVGQGGTGKSHLARYLVEHAAARGISAALVSADMGQPSVGVPACLGLAIGPRWLEASALWFVGDVTPRGHILPIVVGAARLVRHAVASGAPLVVLDTSGLVGGAFGRALKYHKALAAGVDAVVGLARADELDPLLRLLAGVAGEVHRLAPATPAHDRLPAERRAYRQARFAAHFAAAREQRFRVRQLVGPEWAPGLAAGEPLPTPGTVVGLLDPAGFCLGLGVLAEARRDTLVVRTPVHDPDAVARLQAGGFRLGPGYEETR